MDVGSRVMSSKRQKLLGSEESTRVGFLLESTVDPGNYQVTLYGVDIDSETASPVLRITLKDGKYPICAVCVLKSTIYIFGGCVRRPDSVMDNPRDCWKYVLRSDQCFKDLNIGDLKQVSSMNRSKVFPTAIPTPDGKILVFEDDVRGDKDFELYNPQENTWTVLPGLPCCSQVRSFSFIDESHLFLRTELESFVLDLGEKKVWSPSTVPKEIFIYLASFGRGDGHFVTAGDGQYALTSSGKCIYVTKGGFLSKTDRKQKDICLVGSLFQSKAALAFEDDREYYGASIIPLESQSEGVCKTCLLRVKVRYRDKHRPQTCFRIYVCESKPPADLESTMEMEYPEITTITKRIKLCAPLSSNVYAYRLTSI